MTPAPTTTPTPEGTPCDCFAGMSPKDWFGVPPVKPSDHNPDCHNWRPLPEPSPGTQDPALATSRDTMYEFLVKAQQEGLTD